MLDISPLRIPSGYISPQLTCHISLSYWSKIRSVIYGYFLSNGSFCSVSELYPHFLKSSIVHLITLTDQQKPLKWYASEQFNLLLYYRKNI